MFATGGAPGPPSIRNPNVEWVFSSSLRQDQLQDRPSRSLPEDGHFRIAIACRLEPRKGADIVIQSMPMILQEFPKATLDVIGDGSELAALRKLSESLEVGAAVQFHGKLSQKAVLEVLQYSHVFCFPTSASEGFPKAVLEALAVGLPVVTTRVSVLPELIQCGCGLLVDEPDPTKLAEAVGRLLSDGRLYSEMSLRARITAKQYSLENWQKQIGGKLRKSWSVESLAE